MPYQMYLILNHIQYLALSKQNQILTYGGPKYLQKQNNEDFFVHLLNAWLHHTNNNFPHVCKKLLTNTYFQIHHPNWFSVFHSWHTTQEYFRQNYYFSVIY